jgi:hypothetical protein
MEQRVLAQWQLKRVWAGQTGGYERLKRAFPAETGATHPERMARCFLDDCAHELSLDRLSRHYTRLANIFHKAARKLDLLRDRRRKRLSRPRVVSPAGEEALYGAPETASPSPASEPLAAPASVRPGPTAGADRDPPPLRRQRRASRGRAWGRRPARGVAASGRRAARIFLDG